MKTNIKISTGKPVVSVVQQMKQTHISQGMYFKFTRTDSQFKPETFTMVVAQVNCKENSLQLIVLNTSNRFIDSFYSDKTTVWEAVLGDSDNHEYSDFVVFTEAEINLK